MNYHEEQHIKNTVKRLKIACCIMFTFFAILFSYTAYQANRIMKSLTKEETDVTVMEIDSIKVGKIIVDGKAIQLIGLR